MRRSSARSTTPWRASTGTYPFDVRVGSLVLLALLERGPDYAFGTVYDLADDRVVDVLATLIERGLLGRARPRRRGGAAR